MNKIVRIVVTAVLLAWVFWQTDWIQLGKAMAGFRPGAWLAAAGVLGLAQLASAWRWQLFARALGFRRSYGQMVQFYFIGMYFNLLLPTSVGGDVVRIWYLDGGQGRRLAALGAVFLDRLSGLAALLTLSVAAVTWTPLALPPWLVGFVWTAAAATAVGLLAAPRLARLSERLRARWNRIATAVRALGSPGLLGRTTAVSFGIQAANVLVVALVAESLGVAVPLHFLALAVPVVSLLTMAPISLNGMGVREGATVLLFGLAGVAAEEALALALLWFAVALSNSMLGGVVYLCGRRPAQRAAQPPAEDRHGSVDRYSDQGRAGQLEAAA